STRTPVAAKPPLRTFSTSSLMRNPKEATPRQIAWPSTPASIRAATVMSPLMPLKQSKWATFTVTGLLPAHSTGLVVQNPGKWYDDPQPGDHGLLMNDRP